MFARRSVLQRVGDRFLKDAQDGECVAGVTPDTSGSIAAVDQSSATPMRCNCGISRSPEIGERERQFAVAGA